MGEGRFCVDQRLPKFENIEANLEKDEHEIHNFARTQHKDFRTNTCWSLGQYLRHKKINKINKIRSGLSRTADRAKALILEGTLKGSHSLSQERDILIMSTFQPCLILQHDI